MARNAAVDAGQKAERLRAAVPNEMLRQDKRYIYNGDPVPQFPGYALRPNKRVSRRKISTFNIILFLFGVAVAIVLYIGNFIAVNQLAYDVGQLQTRYDKILNDNATLQAEINRKSGWERIGSIAAKELGLQHSKEQPTLIEVEEEKLDRVKEW
jgi:cell division protein FtsL